MQSLRFRRFFHAINSAAGLRHNIAVVTQRFRRVPPDDTCTDRFRRGVMLRKATTPNPVESPPDTSVFPSPRYRKTLSVPDAFPTRSSPEAANHKLSDLCGEIYVKRWLAWRGKSPLCHCVTSPPRCGGDKNLSGFGEMPPPLCGEGGP